MSAITVTRMAAPDAAWDAFVRAQPGWTPFHLAAWHAVVRDTWGHEQLLYVARDAEGAWRGVLRLVRVKSPIFGHYLVSEPFVNYGGPLGEPDAVRALVEAALDRARSDKVDLLELRSRHEVATDLEASHRKITVVMDLKPGAPDAVFKGLDSKLRSQVRRPAKEGVTMRFGPEQAAPFFSIFARHMRDLGTPTQPLALFENIARHFGDDAWFGCAYLNDIPIAGGVGFRWNGEFEMTWASALREYNKVSPNMLVYWAFIERACNEGLSLFNFGRCSPDGGTHKFKKQWGSRDEELWWYGWSPSGVGATPSPDSAKFQLATRVWQKLPLGLTNRLGPALVRFIP